jgi:type IV fimbrial biogenesis protein FimT
MTRHRGFTLAELAVTLLLAGILLGLGIPSFAKFTRDARRTADVNAFVLAIQLARSEAFKRGRPVVLCKTLDRFRCAGRGVRYDAGWMVFVELDEDRPPRRSAAEPLLFAHTPTLRGTITANREWFEFRPYYRRSVNGTVVFCDEGGRTAARAVIVSYTGRPRVDSVGADGEPLPCADLS